MERLEEFTISKSATLRDVFSRLEATGLKIVFVVDGPMRLIGTITDGDLRRATLRKVPLSASVMEIMNPNFTYVIHPFSNDAVVKLMRVNRLQQIPVISQDGALMEVVSMEDLLQPPRLENTMVIMAGGKGERLRPLTDHCPKPMLKVGDKPILEIILQRCIDSGITEFLFSVNYLKDIVKDYFGDGREWSVKIEYLEEDKPLGTAGALSLIDKRLEAPVLVMNGDVLTRVDFADLLKLHEQTNASATVCVRHYEFEVPYGVVSHKDGQVLKFEEKPRHSCFVNAGVYVLNAEVISSMKPNSYYDMPSLLQQQAEAGERISAFSLTDSWLDVGNPDALLIASNHI